MRARAGLLVSVTLLAACDGSRGPGTVRFEGDAFGTRYVVQVADALSESDRIGVGRDIDQALENVNRRMSTYEPDSEISRFNDAAAGEPFPISNATWSVVSEALEVSALTSGAFDVTVGPLVDLWGFGPGVAAHIVPDPDTLRETRARVGWERLHVDDDPPTLEKDADGVECDLSAIAKGYAVDQVHERLTIRGVRNFMIEVGGEVRTLGKNASGEAWRIGIERPLVGEQALQRTVSLSGLAMATSGDYRNFFEADGEFFSHLIDPRTGRPVDHTLASVSVIHASCMRADALASGLLVLGPKDGYELAVKEDLAVLFLLRSPDGNVEEIPSPSFQELFF